MDFLIKFDNVGAERLWHPSAFVKWFLKPRSAEINFRHRLSNYPPKSINDGGIFKTDKLVNYLMSGQSFIACVINDDDIPANAFDQWSKAKNYGYFWTMASASYKQRGESGELNSFDPNDHALQSSNRKKQYNFVTGEIRLINICYKRNNDKRNSPNIKISDDKGRLHKVCRVDKFNFPYFL